jgi:hypothetical protein
MNMINVQQPMPSSHEAVVVGSTAVSLTATKYNAPASSTHAGGKQAAKALITVESASIRWTCDGTTPVYHATATSATGHSANVDDVITLEGYDAIRLFKAIRNDAATDALVRVSYFGG